MLFMCRFIWENVNNYPAFVDVFKNISRPFLLLEPYLELQSFRNQLFRLTLLLSATLPGVKPSFLPFQISRTFFSGHVDA